MFAADQVPLDQNLFVQRGQAVHRPGERILHLGQVLDRRTYQFEDLDSFRFFGPRRETGFLEVARQADAAGRDNPVMGPLTPGYLSGRDKESMDVGSHHVVAASVTRALVCLISSRKIAASSKSSSAIALLSFFSSNLSRSF